MGGDFGPRSCVLATLEFLQAFPHIRITLVGDQQQITPLIPSDIPSDVLSLLNAEQVVEMAEAPASALRHKQASSMWQALKMVADGKADACVSAGNTGALMAMSCHLIRPFEGIRRPAICKPMPTARGRSLLLDLGANIECNAEQLTQFGLMGTALAKIYGDREPKVALLNVGAEASKGGVNIQQAAKNLEGIDAVNFVGFVEGDEIFSGEVDVIVCDGFAGNVALKTSEGVAKFAVKTMREQVETSLFRRLLALPLGIVLRTWWKKYNPSLYNGAALLGLRKIVVKSHGAADKLGFYKAIEAAKDQVEANIAARVESSLKNL